MNNRGCVKSIQRGTKDAFFLEHESSIRIDIANVDLNKSILISDYDQSGGGSLIFNLLNNAIVIKNTNTDPTTKVWISGYTYQVVEFY